MVDNLIKLFRENAEDFTSLGLGMMDDCISCVVTEERNGAFELEMVYPVTGKRFDDIQTKRLIVARADPYKTRKPQAFRIYSVSKPMNGKVTINAQHISYDLNGIVAQPFSVEDAEIDCIWDEIAADGSDTFPRDQISKFVFTSVDPSHHTGNYEVKKPTGVKGILGGQQGSILQTFELGEYEFDNYNINWYSLRGGHQGRGKNRGVTVRYGKNLQDIKQDENIANMYDAVYPYWFQEAGESGGSDTLVVLDNPIFRPSLQKIGNNMLDLSMYDPGEDAYIVHFQKGYSYSLTPFIQYDGNDAVDIYWIPESSATEFVIVNSDGTFVCPETKDYFVRFDSEYYPDLSIVDIRHLNCLKVLPLDLTDKFESQPSEDDLIKAAKTYISDNSLWKPEISIQVTMAVLNEHPEFENVRLCDTVNVYFEQYGINADAKVIKTVYDCKKGRYQSLELGDAIRDLSDSLSN